MRSRPSLPRMDPSQWQLIKRKAHRLRSQAIADLLALRWLRPRPEPAPPVYLEDLPLNRWMDCGSVTFHTAGIIAFARCYDPQPFHTEPSAALHSDFGNLAASALHTLSACVGCTVRTIADVAVAYGLGLDEVALRRPVWPGDTLRVRACWTSARLSRSRPGYGVAHIIGTGAAANDGDAEVIRFGIRYLVRRRPQEANRA